MGYEQQKRHLVRQLDWMSKVCEEHLENHECCNGCYVLRICKQLKRCPRDFSLEQLKGKKK